MSRWRLRRRQSRRQYRLVRDDMEKLSEEVAQVELDNIVKFFEVNPEGESWEDSKARLMQAIIKGRVILDEDNQSILLTLTSPIKLENSQEIKELTFHEPTARDLRDMDKYKENEKMAKTIHLASKMTGQPIGIVERMGARDLQTMGSIASLFF